MEERREVRIPLETVIKRSWPLLAFGAVLLIAVIVGLISFAVSGKGRKSPVIASVQATTTQETQTTSTGDLVSRALDGIPVTPAEAQLQPFAVMVENHTDARPLSGPAKANLVYEVPVEGGITRYLLVFDATTTADQIGPVRSARKYFVEFADGLNAVYGHVGGSPEALDMIKGMTSFRDLNEFWNGKYFWRSAKRLAPHNTFTRVDLLRDAFVAKTWKTGHFRGWHYKEDDVMEGSASTSASLIRGTTDGPRLAYGGSYNATWKYDQTTNQYTRSEAGEIQKDQDGTVVHAKNIVVMQTDGSVIDSYGRLKIRTTGRGKATLYRDGKMFEVRWVRAAGEHIGFETLDGNDTLFNRGTTWIEVVIDPTVFGQASVATTSTASTR